MHVEHVKNLLLTTIALAFGFETMAQKISVKGGFVEDSLLIGQNINFWISASYPKSLEMIFPDSSASFSYFEFVDKSYFATEVRGGLAYDSTVYTLQSFEIDPIQYLQLKAVIFNGADSTTLHTPIDSIILKELAPNVSDTTRLKSNVDYQVVNRQFNYPLLYYIIGGFVVLTILLLLIFGKKIIKFFRVRKLEKEYKAFSESFDEFIQQLKKDPQPLTAELAITFWKNYQQRLDKIPYTSLTTKEILSIDFISELEHPLKSIDRTVYGKKIQDNLYQDFQQVENFVDERFKRKIDEIKYGS